MGGGQMRHQTPQKPPGHALLPIGEVCRLQAFMHEKQEALAVRLGQLQRLAQGLDVRISVLVRPGLQALDLPRKLLNLGQQVVEALLCRGQRRLLAGLDNEVEKAQEMAKGEGL